MLFHEYKIEKKTICYLISTVDKLNKKRNTKFSRIKMKLRKIINPMEDAVSIQDVIIFIRGVFIAIIINNWI